MARARRRAARDHDALLRRVLAFRDARDWKKFHNPKDLAISIALEAAELLEHFQWENEAPAGKKEAIADEIADVAVYLFELADNLGIDLKTAIYAKLDKNAKKYPVEKSKGRITKYTDL